MAVPDKLRVDLQTQAESFTAKDWGNAIKAIQSGDKTARTVLAAGLLCAGFRQPLAIETLYDNLASSWLGKPVTGDIAFQSRPLPAFENSAFTPEFWAALWELLDDSTNLDALNLTARVAALGGLLDPRFGELAEQASRTHEGAANPHQRTPPAMIDLVELGRAPTDSLAGELHHMLVDNGYDAEVLDRQALGLSELPPGLSYLNTRILQMHDVWHLTAGYQTTSLHEIAISGFQLAQFGHNYSAMFLAVVITIGCTARPEGLPILLQIISEAWQHGRTTPSLMAIAWEQEWHKSIEDIRAEQGISAFSSTLPPNLFETLAQANT